MDLTDVEFVANVHELTAQAHETMEFLEALIDNPNIPPAVVATAMKSRSIIRIQDVLVRALFEENQKLMERLAEFIQDKLDQV